MANQEFDWEGDPPPPPPRLRRQDAGGYFVYINQRKYYITPADLNNAEQVNMNNQRYDIMGVPGNEYILVNGVRLPVLSSLPDGLEEIVDGPVERITGGRRRSKRRSRKSKRSRRSRRV